MKKSCKNCGFIFEENYCNRCGQAANTGKLSGLYIVNDLQNGLFSFDNGILYSAKQLFTRPGHAIREFIAGKRINHHRPLSLVVLLATVYGLLYHFLDFNILAYANEDGNSNGVVSYNNINELISTHYAITILLSIPLYAVASYLIFKKQGYNFVEHMVLNAFVASQKIIIHLCTIPFIYFIHSSRDLKLMSELIFVLDFLLLYWCYSQFFNTLSRGKSFVLTLLANTLFLIILMSISVLIILILK